MGPSLSQGCDAAIVHTGTFGLVTGNEGTRFADDDPEYATDAAAEIDVEAAEFVAADPQIVPADLGDSGTAEPPAGDG
jgi:hypothetical protein